ncbi:MAG: hypothetical protein AAF561_14715, partial [Planctomycetota bacterium]
MRHRAADLQPTSVCDLADNRGKVMSLVRTCLGMAVVLAATGVVTLTAARGSGVLYAIKQNLLETPVRQPPLPVDVIRDYDPVDPRLGFTHTVQDNATGTRFTCIEFGPDGRLWATDVAGRLYRFPVSEDGTLGEPEVRTTIIDHAGGPRLIIGFAFSDDGSETYATSSYATMLDAPDFSGKVIRLHGPDFALVETLVIGLPRSVGDHATNQPEFGPDGALYIPQASNTATGGTDETWGYRKEHTLSATILRLDLDKLAEHELPLDVTTLHPGHGYDPHAPDAPLTIYGHGIRLVYDMEWVDLPGRGWTLFAPTNGSSPGGTLPADPVSGFPGKIESPYNEHDWLHRVEPGMYHGHPNPAYGTYVLNGGNPTDGPDLWEVPDYPVGTQPDPNYQPAILDFGEHESSNGVITYRAASDSFTDRTLDGTLIVCRYSSSSD